jgi:hypothetical protein
VDLHVVVGLSLFPSSVQKEGTGYDPVEFAPRSSLLGLPVGPIGGHGHYALLYSLLSLPGYAGVDAPG